jgi:hypothetical protein
MSAAHDMQHTLTLITLPPCAPSSLLSPPPSPRTPLTLTLTLTLTTAAELIIHATFLDLLATEGCFLICLHSPQDISDAIQLPPESAKRDRLDVLPGSCVKLTPLPPAASGKGAAAQPQVLSELTMHLDAHTKHLPSFMISFVLKVLGPFLYKQVLKLLKKNFNSPEDMIPKRMAQRAELYEAVSAAVKRHMAGGQPQ